MRALPAVLLAALLVAGCSGGSEPAAAPSATASPTMAAPTATPTPLTGVPRPRVGACHRLSYADAVAPTDESAAVPCRTRHTAVTFAVGSLDDLAVVDGHLLAVDSARVQQRLAQTCPRRLAAYVGGSPADRGTSMLRAIWFSPTVEQSDAGQSWWRCDVTLLAGEDRLAELPRSLAGALTPADWRLRYGMCGTTDPAKPAFRRVVCAARHTWEAVGVGTGVDDCEAPARARAEDPLTVTWSYEPPTRAERAAGDRTGVCWTPSG